MVRLLLLFFSLPTLALAETIQNRWKVPDGYKSDLSQTFTSGQTLPVSWQSMNESTNDLWVTTWNYNEVQYSSLIARNIDISVDGSYAWTIAIPSSQLSKSAKYVLRFKKPGTVYKAATLELSSPAFLVLAGEAAAPSSAITSSSTRTAGTTSSSSVQSASSTAAATSSFPSTSTSPSPSSSPSPSPSSSSPSPSPSPSSSPSSSPSPSLSSTSASAPTATSILPTSTTALSSLSLGAKIGIGVGIAAVVVALASLFYWLCCCCCRRRSRRKQQNRDDGNDDRKYQRPQWATEGDWTRRHHAMEMYHVNGGGGSGGGRGKELTALPELPGESGPRRW